MLRDCRPGLSGGRQVMCECNSALVAVEALHGAGVSKLAVAPYPTPYL